MKPDPRLELARDIGSFAYDPLKHCLYAFPWGEGPLENMTGPRKWQGDTMVTIRDHLANPETRFQPLRIAITSGHGIGKSAEAGMLSQVGARLLGGRAGDDYRQHRGPACHQDLAGSREVARMAITRDWFNRATMKISSKERPESWRLDFVTWSKNNTEAFAGLAQRRAADPGHHRRKLIDRRCKVAGRSLRAL
jgi:hypothetical protein